MLKYIETFGSTSSFPSYKWACPRYLYKIFCNFIFQSIKYIFYEFLLINWQNVIYIKYIIIKNKEYNPTLWKYLPNVVKEEIIIRITEGSVTIIFKFVLLFNIEKIK